MSKVPKQSDRFIPDSASWSNLDKVFDDNELASYIESLERRFNVKDEAVFFSHLVNMSTASKEPFHRWIRYREGYAGELVKEILKRYPIDSEKCFVMDPMCGSGSSLVATKQCSFDSIGLDVNGYAVLASKVKVSQYTDKDLSDIRSYIDSFNASKITDVPIDDKDGLSKYFSMSHFIILYWIKYWIKQNILGFKTSDFFNLALLAILEDCSNRKKDGNGLATRPSPVLNPKDRMIEQLELMFIDISQFGGNQTCINSAEDCSALHLTAAANEMESKSKKKLGAIIFSPPYANSFDYFESYKLELIFGDYTTVNGISKARDRLIRNYRVSRPKAITKKIDFVENISNEILQRIPEKEAETGVRDGRTRIVPNMLRGYFEDMSTVINEGYQALMDGGMMHIVVDQSAYVGVPIPTDLFLAELGQQAGFKVEGLISCRRAQTSGQQLRKFPYLKFLLRESIISLRKSTK